MTENRLPAASPRHVFVTGGTGFMGRRLIAELLRRGHTVHALARAGSEGKLPPGCTPVTGDPLEKDSFAGQVRPADTFVQLVGVSHPSPFKPEQFRQIDYASARASVSAAADARIRHFIYVSVAQPAPVMKAYIQVRSECEEMIRWSGLNATILRPWYVLGPGRRWPYLLLPMYWLLGRMRTTRELAWRLGLVTVNQMVGALAGAVDNPVHGIRVLDVHEIRQA
jgi:uncharacterized protein YbjT (DUF2867 family)